MESSVKCYFPRSMDESVCYLGLSALDPLPGFIRVRRWNEVSGYLECTCNRSKMDLETDYLELVQAQSNIRFWIVIWSAVHGVKPFHLLDVLSVCRAPS